MTGQRFQRRCAPGPVMTPSTLPELRQQLVVALAQGTMSVSTPELGEVVFRSVAEIKDAIAWLDMQTALAGPTARTFVFQSTRGTGGGGCG